MPVAADFNWLAVLVVTVLGFVLGGLWYSPLLFGNRWLSAIGKNASDLGSPAPAMSLTFFMALTTAIVLAFLVHGLGIDTLAEGMILGLLVGVGITGAAMASDYAFCRWPMELFLIQAGYRVAYTVLSSAILAVWR